MAEPKIGRKCAALTRPHSQRRAKERTDSGTEAAGPSLDAASRIQLGTCWPLKFGDILNVCGYRLTPPIQRGWKTQPRDRGRRTSHTPLTGSRCAVLSSTPGA